MSFAGAEPARSTWLVEADVVDGELKRAGRASRGEENAAKVVADDAESRERNSEFLPFGSDGHILDRGIVAAGLGEDH